MESGNDELPVLFAGFRGDDFREASRLGLGQPAVGEREGLLRHDRRTAQVAFGHAGSVEDFQELHFLLRCAAQIEAAAPGNEPLLMVDLRPAHRGVQIAGNVEQIVTHEFGFHATRVHAPQVNVVRVQSRVGFRGR